MFELNIKRYTLEEYIYKIRRSLFSAVEATLNNKIAHLMCTNYTMDDRINSLEILIYEEINE